MPPLSTPPPSFGDLSYWNTRFSSEENFDWLAGFTILEPRLREIINGGKRFVTARVEEDGRAGRDGGRDGKGPQILHIGCGNSSLSFQLPGLVDSATQIHNCDYSSVVIERQRQREKELLQNDHAARSGEQEVQSRWSVLDLLDPEQIANVRKRDGEEGGYDIIIDKSTTDAISCAEDVEVGLPYCVNNINTCTTSTSSNHTSLQKAAIYPPHILAIHLAYLARPGCRWVVLSYSSSRFSDWEKDDMPRGLPQPSELWKLVKHEKIIQPPDPGDRVHRPQQMHHFYVLERTGVELEEV